MCLGMLCFLSLGIACAAAAASWLTPPDACAEADTRTDVCDSVPLMITNTFQAVSIPNVLFLLSHSPRTTPCQFFIKVFSFVEVGVFAALLPAIILSLRARPTTTVAYSVMTEQENS